MTSKTSLSALARPSLIAAAVFAMTAGLAQAQSNVTLYGRADVGVQYTNKSARADDPLYEVANGGRYPSIWGLKGTEDLGGGLSAVFNLEAHFATDTGAGTGAAGSSGSGGFRRQANVGIKSEYGTVLLGRQYSPEIFANIGTEPRAFKEQFSGLYPYALMQAPAGNPVNDLGIFNGNAVTYSNNFGPIYIGAGVAAGEGTGRTYVIGANYTSSAFVVSASYQQIEQAPDLDGSKHTMGGVAVPFGPFTVKANVQYGELYSATGANVKTNEITFYGVGADWAWNPTNTLNLTYYSGENKIVAGAGTGAKPKADTFIVSNDYAISKRTTLYVQAAYSDADAAPAGFQYLTISPLLINGGQRGGAKTSMFGAGISHNF